METYFVTGISTDIGKTVVSAILTEALNADYWKPIQAGELEFTDADKVSKWVQNPNTKIHPTAIALQAPMSPHAAADLEGVKINAKSIKRPKTKNSLVVEGAGGILVPLNENETILDLIQPKDKVVVVSKHYLGSINHTLLTIEKLKMQNCTIAGIIFNGPEHPSTESIIAKMTQVPILGRLENEPYIDSNVVTEYAEIFRNELTRNR